MKIKSIKPYDDYNSTPRKAKALGAFPHPGHYLEWSKIKNVWPYMTKQYSTTIRAVDYKLPTCVLIEYE